jgi:hypothetical protein
VSYNASLAKKLAKQLIAKRVLRVKLFSLLLKNGLANENFGVLVDWLLGPILRPALQ